MRSVEALAAASLFRGVSLDRLGALVSEGEQRRLADGDVLLRPGDHNGSRGAHSLRSAVVGSTCVACRAGA
jgi:hypothetical protein